MRKLHKGTSKTSACIFILTLLLALSSCNKPRYDIEGQVTDENPTAKHRKVLIIGLSGMRADALKEANVPHINNMLEHSTYSYDALTEAPTLEAPGWSSMLTGVWSAKHGVVNDTYAGNKFDQYPMLFKHIKEYNSNLKTIAISSTTSINTNLVTNADITESLEKNDEGVKTKAVAALTDADADVVFINFNGVNTAGDTFGYDTSIPEYMDAIELADTYVASLTAAIDSRATLENEDWLIIVSTDHGGTLTGTGGSEYEATNIFTVFYNKNFGSRNVAKSQTNTTFLKFQPALTQYAYCDSSLFAWDNYRKFTLELRVKFEGNLSGEQALLSNKNWATGLNPGFIMVVNAQKWKFNAGDGTRRIDLLPLAATPPLNDGVWHHLAVTVNRDGFARTYQDGKFVAQSTTLTAFRTLVSPTKGKITIHNDGNLAFNNGKTAFAKVNIADVRVWTDVLDDETIGIYAKCDTVVTPDHPYYSKLIGWWRGIDAKGSLMRDYSLKKTRMTIIGSPRWEETGKDQCGKIVQGDVPKSVDIAAQVYSWLRIPIKPEWGLDGKVWLSQH